MLLEPGLGSYGPLVGGFVLGFDAVAVATSLKQVEGDRNLMGECGFCKVETVEGGDWIILRVNEEDGWGLGADKADG